MTSQIRQKIDAEGVVVIEDFISEQEINELKNEVENLIENMPEQSKRTVFSTTEPESQQNKDKYFLDSADKISYFFESGALGPDGQFVVDPNIALNKIGHALHDLNPVFRRITFDERVKEAAFQLGFEEPVIVQSMYIFKNPGVGGEVVAHQDATYLHTEPVKLVGFWIPLEDATIENGCLWYAPGSHKSGVHRKYQRNPDENSEELLVYDSPTPHYQKSNFVPLPVRKGSCVLIHGQVVHFSEPNKSQMSRPAYTFHVIDQKNTKYCENNWIQPNKQRPFLHLYKN